jgi:hypothetical protein
MTSELVSGSTFWANYSGPCKRVQLCHDAEEWRPERLKADPTGGLVRGRLGFHPRTHDARGGATFAGRPSPRGCTLFISQSPVSFITWVLFYI